MDVKKLNREHPDRLLTVDRLRANLAFAKQTVRHPFRVMSRRWLNEFYPNVFFGYSDHPLDRNGTVINSPQGFLSKWKDKHASCVLEAEYGGREGNSFFFRAIGYDVYHIIDLEAPGIQHTYRPEKAEGQRLALRIDFLRSDVYRLRIAPGGSVPENRTAMVVGEPAHDLLGRLARDHQESGGHPRHVPRQLFFSTVPTPSRCSSGTPS